jgi:hypothetical protein
MTEESDQSATGCLEARESVMTEADALRVMLKECAAPNLQ